MEGLDRDLIELQELFEHGLVAPQDFAIKSRALEERKRQLAGGQRSNLPPDWSSVDENGQKYYLHTSLAKSLVPPSLYSPPQVSELASIVGEAAMNTAVLKNRIHAAQKVVERAGFNNKMKPGVESELSLRQAETDLNALLELLDLRESGRRNLRLEQTQHLSMSQIWNQSEEIRALMDNIVQVATDPAQPPPPTVPLPPVSREPSSPLVPARSVSSPNVTHSPNVRQERGFTSPSISPAVAQSPATIVPTRSLSSLPTPTTSQPAAPGAPPQPPFRVLCQHKYQARNERELSFGKGEHLAIIKVSGDWWYAKNAQKGYGWIPMHFVTIE